MYKGCWKRFLQKSTLGKSRDRYWAVGVFLPSISQLPNRWTESEGGRADTPRSLWLLHAWASCSFIRDDFQYFLPTSTGSSVKLFFGSNCFTSVGLPVAKSDSMHLTKFLYFSWFACGKIWFQQLLLKTNLCNMTWQHVDPRQSKGCKSLIHSGPLRFFLMIPTMHSPCPCLSGSHRGQKCSALALFLSIALFVSSSSSWLMQNGKIRLFDFTTRIPAEEEEVSAQQGKCSLARIQQKTREWSWSILPCLFQSVYTQYGL